MSFFVSKSRSVSVFKDNFSEHFSRYKVLYLVFISFALAGFVVGIISAVHNPLDQKLDHLPDVVLFKYLSSSVSLGQFFLSRVFSLFGMMILCWVLCFNKWLSLLNIVLCVYKGFVIGSTCAFLIQIYKIVGFLNVLLAYLPFCLVSFVCLIVFCVISMKYVFIQNSGCNVLSGDYFCSIKTILFMCMILHFLCCLLQILLLPFISATIIAS